MSAKQLLRLAAVLGIALLVWGAAALARRSEGRREFGAFLPKIDTAAIDTLAVIKSKDTAVIARAGKGWRVNGHPVDTSVVNLLLRTLADTGTSTELVAQRASSHAQLGLTSESGRRIRAVGRGGKVIADFIMGKPASQFGGVYVRRANGPEAYAFRGALADALPRSGEEFRDHRIATVPVDSVGTIEVQRGSRSYALTRGTGGWTFASGMAADSAGVANMLSYYRKVNAIGFGTPAQEDSLHFDTPKWRARLLGRGGAPLLGLVFDSITSGVWVRHDSGGTVFRLDSWTTRQIVPADTVLRKKPGH